MRKKREAKSNEEEGEREKVEAERVDRTMRFNFMNIIFQQMSWTIGRRRRRRRCN